MGTRVQLLGALMVTAAAVLLTGSWVPLLLGGLVLVVAPEGPTLLALSRVAWQKRKIRRKYLAAVTEQQKAAA